MKKPTLLRALLLTALLATATAYAAEDNALVVHLKGGATTAVLLDKLPRATFTATTLHIVGEELELSYPRSEVQRFTYEYVDPAGIATPYDSPALRFTAEAVYVVGLQPHAAVLLYGTDGCLQCRLAAGADGCAVVPTQQLPMGIYVLLTDGLTHKFVKL